MAPLLNSLQNFFFFLFSITSLEGSGIAALDGSLSKSMIVKSSLLSKSWSLTGRRTSSKGRGSCPSASSAGAVSSSVTFSNAKLGLLKIHPRLKERYPVQEVESRTLASIPIRDLQAAEF